ncbi:DUF1302 domain-containing protein [Aquabacterium sp.]|uniref:DUF1302 domain-containing protein n=1 Tax=Aquabacterium sp. TaxID=1872578 RepID=UPI0035AF55DB
MRIGSTQVTATRPRLSALAAALLALGCMHAAHAIEIRTDDGWSGSFDTTLTYGLAVRASKPDKANIGLGNAAYSPVGGTAQSVTNDDGDLNFKRGHLVSNVARATHELDISRGNFGLFGRLTYAYDEVASRDNIDELGGSKKATGHDVRLLDLYVRDSEEIGGKPFSVRLGQQVVNWGESLFIQNGISVINPIDVSLIRSPGTELREAYIPTPMLWASQQLTSRASVEGFVLFRADHYRLDPRGTFFSTEDVVGGRVGTDRIYLNSAAPDQRNLDPSQSWVDRVNGPKARASDQFGMSARYSIPELAHLELGAYAMQYTSRIPILSFTAGNMPSSSATGQGDASYYVEYPDRIKLFGLSGRWEGPFGIALQSEYSYRPNQPIQKSVTDLAAEAGILSMIEGLHPGAIPGSPAPGSLLQGYQRVKMHQVQLGATKMFGQTLGAQSSALAAEVGYTRLLLPKDQYFDAQGIYLPSPALAPLLAAAASFSSIATQTAGFTTRNSWGYVVYYQLDYNDLFMGATLSPRVAFSHDVHGVSPTFNQGSRSLSIGGALVSADKRWKLDLSYTDYIGGRRYSGTDPNTLVDYSSNANPLRDRDFVAASLSYAF